VILRALGVLIGMIALAVGVRLLIYFVPGVFPYNFTRQAIALLGGAYFSDGAWLHRAAGGDVLATSSSACIR